MLTSTRANNKNMGINRFTCQNETSSSSTEEKESVLFPFKKDPLKESVSIRGVTQQWINGQIREIFGHTHQGDAIFLKIILKKALKLLTKAHKISEGTSRNMLAMMVSAKDEKGKTPLQYAIELPSLEHVEVLCQYGAKVNSEEIAYAENAYTPLNSIINLLKIYKK